MSYVNLQPSSTHHLSNMSVSLYTLGHFPITTWQISINILLSIVKDMTGFSKSFFNWKNNC